MVNNFVTRFSNLVNAGVNLARGPIARASMLSLGIRLSGLALAFIQAILTARLLGPTGYGAVATILSAAQVLAMVAMFGFGPMAVREVPALKASSELAEMGAFLRLSLTITFLLSCLLAALAVYVVIPVLANSPEFDQHLAFGGILVVPLALLILLRGWAQGFGRVGNAQVPGEVLRPAIMVCALLASLASGYAFTETDYLAVAILSGFIAVALSIYLLWRSDLRSLPAPSSSRSIGKTAETALPFLGLGLTAILQGEINTLLLAALADAEQTGLFQPIARIAPLLTLPVQAAAMRYSPRMAELRKSGDIDLMQSITRTFAWTTTLITVLLGLALGFAGPWLMLAFGPEFVAIAPLLWLIVVAQVLSAACGPAGIVLIMGGHAGLALAGQLIGLGANVILGIALIPQQGPYGATLAMAGGIIVWNVAMVVVARARTGITPSLLSIFRASQ